MATIEIASQFPNAKFYTSRAVNVASYESRYEGFVATYAFQKLKEQVIENINKYDVIIVMFVSTLRVGAKAEHTRSLKEELSKIEGKALVSVLTLREGGKDLIKVGDLIANCLSTRSGVGDVASHVNSGKNLDRTEKSAALAARIQKRRGEMYDATLLSGALDDDVRAAVERGKNLEKPQHRETFDVLEEAVFEIENAGDDDIDDVVNQCAQRLMLHINTFEPPVNESDPPQTVVYLRTTPSGDSLDAGYDEEDKGGKWYVEDMPVSQLSGCFAAIDCVGEDRGTAFSNKAVLFDHREPRRKIKRPALMQTIMVVVRKKVNPLVMDSINRAAGRLAQNRLLIKLCLLSGTELIQAKNYGHAEDLPANGGEPSWDQTALDVAKMEDVRRKALDAATKEYNDGIADLPPLFSDCMPLFADWTDEKKKKMSERLAEIAKTTFTSMEYEKMNEDTLSWWQKEGEEDIFDLYSDVEEDDEEEYIDLSSDEEEEDSDDDE
ncbi:hypothetical protein ACHAWC_006541 [Mediolabrus comicus]